MSFALDCKKEITKAKRSALANKALTFGMLYCGTKKTESETIFYSTSEDIVKYFSQMVNRAFGIKGTFNSVNLKNDMIKVFEYRMNSSDINIDYSKYLEEIEADSTTCQAFIAGAFVVRGSVNDPLTTKYHLEISLSESMMAVEVQRFINEMEENEFNSKIIKRRNKYIVYMKDAEKIVDFLRIIGATDQAFTYEDVRIERDFSNSINRVINCEVHNEEKSLSAAREQMKYLKYLEYNYPLDKLDQKLLLVMKARYDNPEASLTELCTIIKENYGETISKPGLSHRFAKLKEIASEHSKNKK